MLEKTRSQQARWAVAGLLLSGPWVAVAADDYESLKAEVDALKQEVRQASEWKNTDSVVHLTGYGVVGYTAPESGTNTFSGTGFNPIFHYQYKNLFLLESELEVELEDDGATAVALEYLAIDVFLNDYMTLVAGKFLSPIGQFRQNLHPAWVNKLPTAPLGFGHDGAAPVADVGLQLRGGVPLGGMKLNYALYGANGPGLELNTAGDEIEAIHAEGLGSDNNGNKIVGGRLGFLPIPKLEVGASIATAKASGTGAMGSTGQRDYNVYGADASYQIAGVDLRGEYVKTKLGVDNVTTIDPAAKEWTAWYTQAAYRVGSTPWEVVVRYGQFEKPGSPVTKQWTPGINYLFASNVIAKLAYEANDTDGVVDDDRILAQLAYGF